MLDLPMSTVLMWGLPTSTGLMWDLLCNPTLTL
jgi:hypothetical protein